MRDHLAEVERMCAPRAFEPTQTALLVVDVTNDVMQRDSPLLAIGFDLELMWATEQAITRLVRAARAAGMPTIAVKSAYDEQYLSPVMANRFRAMGVKGAAPKGAPASELADFLVALEPEYVVVKSHYSAFCERAFVYRPGASPTLDAYLARPAESDNESDVEVTMLELFSRAAATPVADAAETVAGGGVASLEALLRSLGVDTLIIAGGATHVCENAAVVAAFERGFRVLEPVDAIGGEDREKHAVYLHNRGMFMSELTTSEDVVSSLSTKN